MTHYIKNGNDVSVAAAGALDLHESLPVGTYSVMCSPDRGFYLSLVDGKDNAGKVYGGVDAQTDRILNTFKDREGNTGVLLSGEKGSGKTMTLRELSRKAAQDGVPTLVVSASYTGESFNRFITAIEQSCIVAFDEFDKVYEKKEQDSILTLLDGMYASKKLFVFTANTLYDLSPYLRNRPGRIFYHLRYEGLEESAVVEYAQENLKNQDHLTSLVETALSIDQFNFDMLKGLIEEMNRYDEPAPQAIAMMNIRPEAYRQTKYKVVVEKLGPKIPHAEDHVPIKAVVDGYVHNPVAFDEPIGFSVSVAFNPNPGDFESNGGWLPEKAKTVDDSHHVVLYPEHFKCRNADRSLMFENSSGTFRLVPVERSHGY